MLVCCRTSTDRRIAETPEAGAVPISGRCLAGCGWRAQHKPVGPFRFLPAHQLNVFSDVAVVPLSARTAHLMPEVFGDPA